MMNLVDTLERSFSQEHCKGSFGPLYEQEMTNQAEACFM